MNHFVKQGSTGFFKGAVQVFGAQVDFVIAAFLGAVLPRLPTGTPPIGLVVAIIFIGALAFGISRVVQNPEQYQKTDPNIEAIMNSCEVTEAQAETIWGILQECGVGSIEIISRDTMLDGLYNTDDIGYRIRTEDGNNPVLYLNGAGEVSQIRWANQTLYPKS